jgi:hypothetical protein
VEGWTITICPNCGQNTPEGKFCEQCGASLQGTFTQVPAPGLPPQGIPPVTQPIPARVKKGSSAVKWVLAIIGIFVVLIIIIGIIGSMPGPSPVITTRTTVPSTAGSYSHTPSETLYGHVDYGGSYRITTNIRDPTTALYSIRLVGPKNADFDLYVKKGVDPTSYTYDYKSAGYSANEQISIPYPAVGDYHILVTPTSGSGDFVLYIDYKYS